MPSKPPPFSLKKEIKGCLGCALIYVFVLFIIAASAYAWYRYDEAKWKRWRAVGGPAYQAASVFKGTCGSNPKRWIVLKIIPLKNSRERWELHSSNGEAKTLIATPANNFHSFPKIQIGDKIEITNGAHPYGEIFSPDPCDYLKVVKVNPSPD